MRRTSSLLRPSSFRSAGIWRASSSSLLTSALQESTRGYASANAEDRLRGKTAVITGSTAGKSTDSNTFLKLFCFYSALLGGQQAASVSKTRTVCCLTPVSLSFRILPRPPHTVLLMNEFQESVFRFGNEVTKRQRNNANRSTNQPRQTHEELLSREVSFHNKAKWNTLTCNTSNEGGPAGEWRWCRIICVPLQRRDFCPPPLPQAVLFRS